MIDGTIRTTDVDPAQEARYLRALEERVMRLEAKVVSLEAGLNRSESDHQIADLKGDGYMRGAPKGLIDTGDIDAKVCADSTCSNCGHVGLRYEPWIRHDPKSYRAFVVCPSCGHREEF